MDEDPDVLSREERIAPDQALRAAIRTSRAERSCFVLASSRALGAPTREIQAQSLCSRGRSSCAAALLIANRSIRKLPAHRVHARSFRTEASV
jgi:hypothetical protein